MRLSATVISHFYNEEYLLPWWLSHHVKIFDHGILIDYGSTDRSVEICRKLAPGWEVVRSKNSLFEASAVDEEVMSFERRISDWKIALNTTEFFCCRDMKQFLWSLEAMREPKYAIRGVVMVDPIDYQYSEPNPEMPLVLQRYHGFFEDEKRREISVNLTRSRAIHKLPHGSYITGRHRSHVPSFMHPPGALILWFGYSPWTEPFRQRKLQIQTKIPAQDLAEGKGFHHILNNETLAIARNKEVGKAEDLRKRPEYARVLGCWSDELFLPSPPSSCGHPLPNPNQRLTPRRLAGNTVRYVKRNWHYLMNP